MPIKLSKAEALTMARLCQSQAELRRKHLAQLGPNTVRNIIENELAMYERLEERFREHAASARAAAASGEGRRQVS